MWISMTDSNGNSFEVCVNPGHIMLTQQDSKFLVSFATTGREIGFIDESRQEPGDTDRLIAAIIGGVK